MNPIAEPIDRVDSVEPDLDGPDGCFFISGPTGPTWVGDKNNRLVAWIWEQNICEQSVAGLEEERPSDHESSSVHAQMLGSQAFWPLVFTGPSGVGKSLLAEHFAHRLRLRFRSPLQKCDKQSSANNFEYFAASGNDFSRSYQQAIAINALVDWRTRCEVSDVLLVDHLVPLADDVAAQHQLCDILDHRCNQQLPSILVSTDLPLRCGLVDRLTSRLSAGLMCPISRPGPAAVNQVIVRSFARLGVEISPAQVQLLVLAGLRDIPVISQICHRWVLEHGSRPFQWELASDNFKSLLSPRSAQVVKPDAVLKTTAKFFQLTIRDLRGASRVSACSRARALAMWICRQYLKISYQQIGQLFGNRDHTTVISSCKKIEAQLTHDAFLQSALQQLLFRLALH